MYIFKGPTRHSQFTLVLQRAPRIDSVDVVVVSCSLDAVTFGYKSVDEYYYDASSCRLIKDVRVPLLCVQVRYTLVRDKQVWAALVKKLACTVLNILTT